MCLNSPPHKDFQSEISDESYIWTDITDSIHDVDVAWGFCNLLNVILRYAWQLTVSTVFS